jgi:hypothetical protein
LKSSLPRPTPIEQDRIEQIKALGCVCCRLLHLTSTTPLEIHHLLIGNKRVGHWYTICLCWMHHQGRSISGLWTSIAQGSKAFTRVHGSQWDLFVKTQHILELPDELPPSKLVARRL